jgi:anti-sigma B factor antagonist
MTNTITQLEKVTVLILSGRLDTYTISEARTLLEKALVAQEPRIVVNLQEVTFADSTALSTLVIALKKARESHGNLRLCCLKHPVRMIFELTRLEKVFEIFNSEAEAVQAFNEEIGR